MKKDFLSHDLEPKIVLLLKPRAQRGIIARVMSKKRNKKRKIEPGPATSAESLPVAVRDLLAGGEGPRVRANADYSRWVAPPETPDELRERIFKLPVLERLENLQAAMDNAIKGFQLSDAGMDNSHKHSVLFRAMADLVKTHQDMLKFTLAQAKPAEIHIGTGAEDNELEIVIKESGEKTGGVFKDLSEYEVTG